MLKTYIFNCLALLCVGLLTASYAAAAPWQLDEELVKKKAAEIQEVLSFEVLVTDHTGEPVLGAKITPWAIGSAQGHGKWNEESNGGTAAESATTDSDGKVTIRYPKYSDVIEEVRSTTISIKVEHPDHPSVSDIHIKMPRKWARTVKLPNGSAIEATVLLDGEPVVEGIKSLWSGKQETDLQVDAEKKSIRIPPVANGSNSMLFVRLDGDAITHFSSIEKIDIDGREKVVHREVNLIPAVSVRGTLSDDVPRPVVNGRVKVQTITNEPSGEEVTWFDWAKVEEDGSFVIDAWPKGEPMQLTALCDGYIASSGDRPPMVSEVRDRSRHLRAQVFMEPHSSEIEVAMEALSTCRIKVENAFGKKLKNVSAVASPNIRWWNSGSQIYCFPLIGGAEFLKTGEYKMELGEGIHAPPFRGTSDENGIVLVQLPAGKNSLWIGNKRYHLPAKLGSRHKRIEVERNKSMEMDLVLQPIGLDVLGDWEDLCGLVFG